MTTINTSVLSIEPLSPHVLKVVLDARRPVYFKAGQYLQVVMSEQDKRPFSIANKPQNDHLLELHIGANPSNTYAYEVIELARTNKSLTVEVGFGDAFLRESDTPAIIIAGGTGYSYAKSILQECLSRLPNKPVHLYWGGKVKADLYEYNNLMQMTTVHKNFSFIPVLETADASWTGKTGFVHKAVLDDFASFENIHLYVAGRFEMAAAIKTEFVPLGLSLHNLFGDAFAFLK